jgi:tetratricopeptide (TPR) repeat protein
MIGNIGCSQEVFQLLKYYDATIIPVSIKNGMHLCRNSLLDRSRYDWQLLLDPWEMLVQGDILDRLRTDGKAAKFSVIQGDHLSYQTRFWRKSKARFVNPVFERVDLDGEPSGGMIISGHGDTLARDLALANDWVNNAPTNPDPYYYRACLHLFSMENYDSFLQDAESYFFMESQTDSPSAIMMRYYLAGVYCFARKDVPKAIQNLASCLAMRPTMAEFWCLLGDIYYHLMRQYGKAAVFYENAMILGSRRLNIDAFPMEISKYEEYPKKMLTNCNEIIAASVRVGEIRNRTTH